MRKSSFFNNHHSEVYNFRLRDKSQNYVQCHFKKRLRSKIKLLSTDTFAAMSLNVHSFDSPFPPFLVFPSFFRCNVQSQTPPENIKTLKTKMKNRPKKKMLTSIKIKTIIIHSSREEWRAWSWEDSNSVSSQHKLSFKFMICKRKPDINFGDLNFTFAESCSLTTIFLSNYILAWACGAHWTVYTSVRLSAADP